jgi:lambda family phage portal protein
MVSDRDRMNIAQPLFEFKQDYDAMRESNYVRSRSGLAPSGGGSDYHIRNETLYLKLVERARDLCRNASIVEKSIEKAATNVVGDGFTLRPETGNKAANDLLYKKWVEWTTDRDQCDIAGEKTWSEMEELAVISCIRDGDIIALGTTNGSLQLIEGHQCRNPKGSSKKKQMVIGVEIDPVRKRKTYHIRSESVDPYRTTQQQDSTAYQVRDANGRRVLFHYFVSTRSTATRGVTALAPCFQKLAMFDDLDFAKLVQAQAISCIVVQRIKDVNSKGPLPTRTNYGGSTTTENNTDGTKVQIQQIAPGTEIDNQPGERLETIAQDIPNTNYFEHAKMLLTMFFLNIGLPYVMGMMDASETNFSGWRAAVEEAKKGFKRQQRQLRDKWHRPIYKWKVQQWIAEDPEVAALYAELGEAIFNHSWSMPRWPYIQPVEDATGKILRQSNMLSSPRRIHGEESQDWETIVDETIEDISYAIRKAMEEAKKINEKFAPEPKLHWRELLNIPLPNGLTVAVTTAPPANNQPTGGQQNGTES